MGTESKAAITRHWRFARYVPTGPGGMMLRCAADIVVTRAGNAAEAWRIARTLSRQDTDYPHSARVEVIEEGLADD